MSFVKLLIGKTIAVSYLIIPIHIQSKRVVKLLRILHFMHEMSIAMSIVKIAEAKAREAHVTEFAAIELEIGTLAGVEFEALDFVWEVAVQKTVLERAEKRIKKIQAKALCMDCEKVYPLEFIHDNCPDCGSFRKTILQGKELRVKSLELS